MTRIVVAPGGTITSAWGNQTHDQGVIQFTNAAQRTADWPAPLAGDYSWLQDTKTLWRYSGTAWVPAPMGVLAVGLGPTAQTDYPGNATTDITGTSITVPLVTGRRYRVSAYANGIQVTATTVGAWVAINEAPANHLPSGQRRLWQALNLAAGSVACGGAAWTFTSTITGNETFKLQAFCNASSFRITANDCQVVVEDIGG